MQEYFKYTHEMQLNYQPVFYDVFDILLSTIFISAVVVAFVLAWTQHGNRFTNFLLTWVLVPKKLTHMFSFNTH